MRCKKSVPAREGVERCFLASARRGARSLGYGEATPVLSLHCAGDVAGFGWGRSRGYLECWCRHMFLFSPLKSHQDVYTAASLT